MTEEDSGMKVPMLLWISGDVSGTVGGKGKARGVNVRRGAHPGVGMLGG